MDLEAMGALEAGAALLITALLFGGGLGCGLWLRRSIDREQRTRLARLEGELAEATSALVGYRDEVEKHFGQTSELFRDLTRQHTALYAHLAEGARELCGGRVPELGRGLAGPLLAADASDVDVPADPATGSVDAADEPAGVETAAPGRG